MLTQKSGWAHFFVLGCLLAGVVCADDLSVVNGAGGAVVSAAGASAAQLDMAVGAGQLAWQRLQGSGIPTDADSLRLRWHALAVGGTLQQILAEAAALPATAPADVRHDAAWQAARAALKERDGRQARVYLSRLLWQMPVTADEVKRLRKQVVQSHLLPQPDADSEVLVLRYEQDYGINPALRLQVVSAYILAKQKLPDTNGLRTGLPDDDPAAVLLDVVANNLSGSVLRQKIGQLLQQPALPLEALQALHVLVSDMNEDELLAQVDERLLNEAEPQGVTAPDVWKVYHGLTQSFANVRLLLFGSDTGWAEQAQQNDDPVMARAIWAYLARQAKDAQLKISAQEHLIDALVAQHESRTALRMFDAVWPGLPAEDFAPSVRWRLGQQALATGDGKLAAALWQDEQILPAGADRAAWLLQRARLFAQVGQWQNAWQAWTGWQATRPIGVLDWSDVLLADGLSHHAVAGQDAAELLRGVLAQANEEQQRFLWFRLGEMQADSTPMLAAQSYLRAAGSTPVSTRDWRATLRAADALRRSGFKDDARHLAQNLTNHCPDAALRAQGQELLQRTGSE